MVQTMWGMLHLPYVSRSFSKTMSALADQSLSSARGNSGILVAEFINCLASQFSKQDSITERELTRALSIAAEGTGKALENPREGTILTVLKVWTRELDRLVSIGGTLRDNFALSLESARLCLDETRHQLEELRRANLVDAGASGFVSFLEGVARLVVTGKVSWARQAFSKETLELSIGSTDLPSTDGNIPYRYCTELLLENPRGVAPDGSDDIRQRIEDLGDSLIVSHGRAKTKIHLHTNEPSSVLHALRGRGRILEQKIDDMVLQYQAIHHPLSPVAVLTDSIADIPQELLDKYHIHVIPLKILWGDEEYLDRLSMTTDIFYPWLDERPDYPGSSIPDPRRVEQVFLWLSAQYTSIIAIPVGKVLSGTYQVLRTAADHLAAQGYTVSVIDSKLNSAAQGLVVLAAAEDASRGKSHAEILEATAHRIAKSRILVSVASFTYMVRGGRISALKGAIAAATHLKPIITLDPDGRGIAYGASFSQAGSWKKIVREVRRCAKDISRYAVVHAGVGAVAVAWI